MSSDNALPFVGTPTQGVVTRSRAARPNALTEEDTDQASTTSNEQVVYTPFDHIFIGFFQWTVEHDCYQALIQNDWITLEIIISQWVDGTASTPKFRREGETGRIFAPAILESSIQSFKYFVGSFTRTGKLTGFSMPSKTLMHRFSVDKRSSASAFLLLSRSITLLHQMALRISRI